jgi:hypothetical protein
MLPLRLRQGARLAQEATQRRIVVAWPPNGTELKCRVSTRDWTENHIRKGRGKRRLAGEAHAVPHRDEMHQRLATDIRLLHARCVRPVGQVFDQAFTKRTAAIRLANDEMLIAKSLPLDDLPAGKRMSPRQHNKKTFIPKRRDVAISRLTRIREECHVKAPLPNQRDLLARRALDNLKRDVWMPLGKSSVSTPAETQLPLTTRCQSSAGQSRRGRRSPRSWTLGRVAPTPREPAAEIERQHL